MLTLSGVPLEARCALHQVNRQPPTAFMEPGLASQAPLKGAGGVCVPLTWHDGALRVHVIAGAPDPGSQVATKGLLVDSGSRDLALHAEDCAECGGAPHAAYVREVVASPATHAAASQDEGRDSIVRHLADGREHLRRTCDVVRIWDGSDWTALHALWEARGPYPHGAAEAAASAHVHADAAPAEAADASVAGDDGNGSDGNGGGLCVTSSGARGLRFSAVVKRHPTPGLEGASVSRGGTFGIGPGSWCTPPHTCVRLDIDAEQGGGGCMWLGCPLPVGGGDCAPLVELQLTSDATRNSDAAGSGGGPRNRERRTRRGPALGKDTYRLAVRHLLVACTSSSGGNSRSDRAPVADSVRPRVAVLDTGSTCMFVSRPLWQELVRLAEATGGDGHAVAEISLGGVDHDLALRVPFYASSKRHQEHSAHDACLRPLPRGVNLPPDVCLVGALALRGCTLLLAPGATPTGRGARAWMAVPDF